MDLQNQAAYRRANITEWILLFAAFLILGVTLAVWYTLESARVTAVEQERLHALSKIVVKEVAINLLAVNSALAGTVRDRLDIKVPIDPALVTMRLQALVEAMPSVRGMIVLDANAKVIAAAPDNVAQSDRAERIYFNVRQAHADPAVLYLAPPVPSARADQPMGVARIITGSQGFQGAVVALLDPSYFSDILHTALYAPDLRATIVHGDGSTLVDVGARGATVSKEDQLVVSATIVPKGVATSSLISLTLRRDLAMVQAPLQQQGRWFAVLCLGLAVISASTVAWIQRRRRRDWMTERDRRYERIQTQAVSASESRFRMLIEEAPLAVAMARHGRFIYTNRRYNLLHGYAKDDKLTGLNWGEMITPASLRALQVQQACLDGDAPVEQSFEAIGVGKGTTLIPLLKATTRVMLSDGPATLIFVQDITAQKTAELNMLEARDAAQAANRSKAEFLANMSHEIRTPLNAILGMAYLLERGNRDADASAMLQKIRVAGRSLLDIINDILDVSKIEAGAMVIEQSWFELQDVIDAVATTMGVAVGDKQIALLVHPLPPMAARVLGDALRLEQLLVNLTSNAIKFTENGRVELDVDAQEMPDGHAELVFSVTDTGIGIESDQQDNIFSSFAQADNSTTRRYGGSGLGLTICKQIVELMGGRIGVNSNTDRGSTFWFALTLPVRPAAAMCSSPEMVALEVMIAAASDPTHAVLADTVRTMGWHAHRVDAGSDADVIAAVLHPRHGVRPNVVILDWQLTGIDCAATARAIRADAGADNCAILILISTYQAVAFETDEARLLADAILTKPVTTSTLYNAVIEAKRNRLARDVTVVLQPAVGQILSGIRILVVDDSGINRDVAEGILVSEGASVVTANDGRVAVDWLIAHPGAIDLVLMDIQMPVMDGIEATRILRAMPAFAELPIVALTAGAFSSHQDAARSAGMSHFVAKPFDIPLTIELIRRVTHAKGAAPASAPIAPVAPTVPPGGALDQRRGLQLWQTEEKYQRYLRKFAAAYGGVMQDLRRDFANGDTDAVAAASHKLAGAAANVALPEVARLARRLESALDDAGIGAALLKELNIAMGAALSMVAEYAPPVVEAAVPAGKLAPYAIVGPLLERMKAALAEGMPEPALVALAQLKPHVTAALLAPIAACIDDYDWEGAAQRTGAIAQHY